MRLSQHTLPQYFSIANADTSWYQEPTNTFDFVDRGSKTLLVTVGDSWTWGSDISINNTSNHERLEHVYGQVLSRAMGADWLNLAISAQGNFWMAGIVAELAKIIPDLEYDRICVVCTFTGVLRWFNTRFDQHIDYIKWFQDHVYTAADFDQLLTMLNTQCVSSILDSLAPYPHVTLKVATNFLDPIGLEQLSAEQRVPRPWYQVLGCADGHEIYTCVYHQRISQAIEFIDPGLHTAFKHWVIDKIDQSELRLQVLKDPAKFRNCHPLAQGHAAWAQYLLTCLN
jgi:hypothetical protein